MLGGCLGVPAWDGVKGSVREGRRRSVGLCL